SNVCKDQLKSDQDDESEQDGINGHSLCPFCDGPMPDHPSAKLTTLKDTLLAMPNIRKGHGRTGAMCLPFTQTAEFCNLHHAECVIIPLGVSKGWPTSIDFDVLERYVDSSSSAFI
ncbi:hypothetical protein DFH28DRAFT_905427, partial [Melampsora americana]